MDVEEHRARSVGDVRDVPRTENHLLVTNGAPGLEAVDVRINRRHFELARLTSGETREIDLSAAAGAKVLLLGMRMPPNYGPDYTEQFRLCYIEVARDEKLPLVPFLLNDIALFPNLMQADGVHPVWPIRR